MVPNRSLIFTKNNLIRTLSSSSYACLHRRLCLLAPAVTPTASTLRPTSSVSVSCTPVSIPHAASSRQVLSLPFSYDPTGLSAHTIKKPSCDNLNLKNSFYRRKLPEHLVSFTSPKGKKLFREMLEEGYGEGYFSLVGNFTTQSETAFCGPSSLAMVLNSLEVDPQRQWKGAWRWYSDELLECCAPVDQVKAKGITFNQFACLSKCNCEVQVRRANQTSLEQFKQDLEMVCSRDDIHMVVSFSRKSLGQTGDGHFSPIGGYVPKAGMVLVLDTARFKYPSYFVSVERLYEALFPIDVETGTSRGYFLLSANPDQPPISLCKIEKSKLGPSPSTNANSTVAGNLDAAAKDLQRLKLDSVTAAVATPSIVPNTNSVASSSTRATTTATTASSPAANCSSSVTSIIDNRMSWTSLAQTFCKVLPSCIQTENPQTLNRMVSVVLQGVPREYAFWISQQQAYRLRDTTELIDSIKSTELYSLVSSAFPAPFMTSEDEMARLAKQQHEGALVFGTLFLMSSPSTLFLTLPLDISKQFENLRRAALDGNATNRVLKEEAERMRAGIVDLVNSFCSCGTKGTNGTKN
ncbi:hypothetical protein BGZ65_002694 [Modicella reniformis]|uniref:glutathione gamma-glutamylcysteinyltransferase n=1 Tax=Modicella reniformis TaxID=1440133 RepID=A0A9P6MIU6_9FUNG|nr:hypothetical protein BGZ65_002694 [Modicella reniformis]